MDIGSAFTFMFDDEEWVKKLAIGGGIMFAALLLMPLFLVGVLLILPVVGYSLEVYKNVRDGALKPLPEWTNFGDLFKGGLFVALIGLVYNLPALLIVCLSVVIQGGLTAAFSDNSDAASIIPVVSICFSCLQLVLSLAGYALMPAGVIRYAQYGTFGAAFQIGDIIAFIRNNIGDYIIVILLAWVASLLAGFGMILCIVGVFFTSFWSYLVTFNLFGQLARKAGTI